MIPALQLYLASLRRTLRLQNKTSVHANTRDIKIQIVGALEGNHLFPVF